MREFTDEQLDEIVAELRGTHGPGPLGEAVAAIEQLRGQAAQPSAPRSENPPDWAARPQITERQLHNWFRYHNPAEHQLGQAEAVTRYEQLRAGGGELARLIVELTPPGADQAAAVRLVRQAVMTANAALACDS